MSRRRNMTEQAFDLKTEPCERSATELGGRGPSAERSRTPALGIRGVYPCKGSSSLEIANR